MDAFDALVAEAFTAEELDRFDRAQLVAIVEEWRQLRARIDAVMDELLEVG